MTGLEADNRVLGEGLRPGVGGVEGVDIDLVDAVSPLPIIQNEIEMLLLLLETLGRAVALAAGAVLKLALLPLVRHALFNALSFLLLNEQFNLYYMACRIYFRLALPTIRLRHIFVFRVDSSSVPLP